MVTKTKFNTLDGKDVTAIQLNSLSSAISTEGREPDPKSVLGKTSIIFKRMGETITDPKNTGEKIISFLVNFAGVVGSTGYRIAGTIGTLVTKGPGAAINYFVSSFNEPITGYIDFAGKNSAAIKAGGIAALSGLTGVALSVATGTSPLQVLRGILNFTDVIYDFNFDTPDSAIWGQIKSTIDGLYGQAGDFLGSSFARLLLIGALAPPKIEIDIDGIALAYNEFAEERKEDLLNGVKSFAYLGVRAAQRISFLFAFLNGRNAIKQIIAASPDVAKGVDKLFPGLSKALAGWGDEENPLTKEEEVKDWRISTFVENKLEKVKDTYGPQIGNFLEQFFEGFTDELRDGLEEYIEYRFV